MIQLPARRWSVLVTLAAAALGLLTTAGGRPAERRRVEAPPRPTTATSQALVYANPASFAATPTTDPDAPFPDEVTRRILALYDSSETLRDDERARTFAVTSEFALAHRLAALPLTHLGVAVDYYDVNQSTLPDDRVMARYRGVLSWFGDNRMARPEAYLRWLMAQMKAGRRVVVMEGLGAYEDFQGRPTPRALVDATFRMLGAEAFAEESHDSSQITLLEANPRLIGFEAPLPKSLSYYQRFVATPATQVYLRLGLADVANSDSDVVWTSPQGGFVLPGLAWREDRISDRYVVRWVLHPFRFFEAAFALEGMPRVDVTTLNGSRIFYSQIDGDGLDTLSELDYKSRCGEIIRDRILRKFDLPFTASIIVGLTAPPPIGQGNPTEVAVARSLLALDNVEVGSHGFAHPFDWRDPKADVAAPGLPGYERTGEWEIARSVDYINRELAPAGKSCRIMLWTGDCNPAEEHLEVAYRLGLRNLNGGDPRMDAHFPSYAHLVAPVHRVGRFTQYFTSAANDFVLTEEWRPPYYGFRNVLQTFERAGTPRRMTAVDVYFHFYSARNLAALTALEEVLRWAVEQPLAPVFASEYVDIVHDAESARIARVGEAAWEVQKGPSLRTVRFDGRNIHVDVGRSRGVLGYLRADELNATYVHLDGSPTARIVLASTARREPRLERASHWVDGLKLNAEAIDLFTHGPGRRTFVFAGLAPGTRYRIDDSTETVVDASGRLTVTPGASGPGLARVRVRQVLQ